METRKVALITGAGTGIGRAIALALAARGIDVVVNYSRSEKEAQDTADGVRAAGASCLLHKADVSYDNEVRQMLADSIAFFGRLDYLVNCAGTTDFVDLTDMEGLKEEYWDRALGVNVKGLFFVSRAAAPHLKKTGGSIVNITSIAGITGKGSSIAYAASKAAAISVTKSLAQVLAPEVRVNSVAPGIVLTRWVAGKEDHVKWLGQGTPLGRVCGPEDVAEIVVPLLLSAGMMTGQTLVVDGGAIM
ncbi:MAG: SDR family oxidoreductase [Negativicutes bacterium]|nr:SDR family oxidoreductase [Negativicutes bacterium]